jgi:hypothetical protein
MGVSQAILGFHGCFTGYDIELCLFLRVWISWVFRTCFTRYLRVLQAGLGFYPPNLESAQPLFMRVPENSKGT